MLKQICEFKPEKHSKNDKVINDCTVSDEKTTNRRRFEKAY